MDPHQIWNLTVSGLQQDGTTFSSTPLYFLIISLPLVSFYNTGDPI